MSLRLPCPTCGSRDLEEWVYGEILDPPDTVVAQGDDAIDVDRGFMHNNPAGVVREAWFHLYGCRRRVTFERDTTTDRLV